MHPENVSPVVAWLACGESADVTGPVIEVEGGRICMGEGWRHGHAVDIGERWLAASVRLAVRDLLGRTAVPEPVYGA